jgi:hypothetical protein
MMSDPLGLRLDDIHHLYNPPAIDMVVPKN